MELETYENCKTPVVLFCFKRIEKTIRVLEAISKSKPKKLFIVSDFGRNKSESIAVTCLRERIEKFVDWDCQLYTKYATENLGVYKNITSGIKWVFETEESAIFLEDDNVPESTFFPFCEELLSYYKHDNRVLWVCGTNYLRSYSPEDGASYVFSQHMMPCGWASWNNKFSKFYDGNLELWSDPHVNKKVRDLAYNSKLKKQDISNWDGELRRIKRGQLPVSWDYQMSFALRVHGLYSAVPVFNQIKNIGADIDATHGGSSMTNIMVQRFCELETMPLKFPLVHPRQLAIDKRFELRSAKIIVLPLRYRLTAEIALILKQLLGCDIDLSLKLTLKLKVKTFLKSINAFTLKD